MRRRRFAGVRAAWAVVVMLLSALFTLNAWRGQNQAPQASQTAAAGQATGDRNLRVVQGGKKGRSRTPKAPKRGSMMERFEERWRRRREQGPY